MKATTDWRRVSRAEVCPICDRPDWCLLAGPEGNPTAAICARIESPKRCGEAGWLHRLRGDDRQWQPRRRTIRFERPAAAIDFERFAVDCQAAADGQHIAHLAESLGLSIDSLRRLRVGWSECHRSSSFPMSDAAGKVRGIRLRTPYGRKFAVRGGKEGLFLPADLDGGGLLITEGPTDCAALLDLGFAAVGRPSCTGGIKLLVDLVKRRQPSQVVIVSDADAAGQHGANDLASAMQAYAQAVRVITPPDGIKDARQWKQRGATHEQIKSAIDVAPVRRLAIKGMVKNGI